MRSDIIGIIGKHMDDIAFNLQAIKATPLRGFFPWISDPSGGWLRQYLFS
jgi:hypothetical protein